MSKLKIFIASSTEARERDIVPELVRQLGNDFEVFPWYECFEAMKFTLEGLLEISNKIDATIIVLTKDGQGESRGNHDWIPRDNVVFECGMLISKLGRDRVRILKEEDVRLPSDLDGLVLESIPSRGGSHPTGGVTNFRNSYISKFSNKLIESWENLEPLAQLTNDILIKDDGMGVRKTIDFERNRNRQMISTIQNFVKDERQIDHPLKFSSRKLSLSTYTEALDLVHERFWTTTFLSSEFWTSRNSKILDANSRLMKRLKQKKGDARRLFIINNSINEEVQVFEKKIINLREQNNQTELKSQISRLSTLKSNTKRLINSGCEVRVAYHDNQSNNYFPDEIISNFNSADSELAIYDSFRLDIFHGGKVGRISEVLVYTHATRFFQVALETSIQYFNHLWDVSSKPIEKYFEELKGYQ